MKRLDIFKTVLFLNIIYAMIFSTGMAMTQVEKIKYVFNALRADNIHILDDFYAPDTKFIDPLGVHRGLSSVKSYYQNLYKSVNHIHFQYLDLISHGSNHVLVWKMTLEAKSLNGGKPITLDGNSHIKFNEKNLVIYHRDYFDMGEFIYQHIPFLGWVIERIKNKIRH